MVTLDQIYEAEKVVGKVAHYTRLMRCAAVAERCGLPADALLMKMENEQRTGSFKIRGASYRLSLLSPEEREKGVCTASAGNHAQGVALAARLLGIKATIFMSQFASIAKIQATRGYGAEVRLEGRTFDESVAAGQRYAAESGAVYISAYDDDGIITGQGTLGLELVRDVPDLETLIICIGGGGLFSGVTAAVKSLLPNVKVVGVQAAGSRTAVESFHAGKLLPARETHTIADGIAVKSPSERTFAYIKKYADNMVTVEDPQIAEAMLLLMERAKSVVEPSGAAGIAALMTGVIKPKGKTAVVVSGGNVDTKFLANMVEREMIRANRYMQFFSAVPDRPGGLASLLELIAELKGNIISVVHNRISPTITLSETGVELLLEVRDAEHIAEIRNGLLSRGFRVDMLS